MLSWWREVGRLMRIGTLLCVLNVILALASIVVPALFLLVIPTSLALVVIATLDRRRDKKALQGTQTLFDTINKYRGQTLPLDELPIEIQEEIKIMIAGQKLRG